MIYIVLDVIVLNYNLAKQVNNYYYEVDFKSQP